MSFDGDGRGLGGFFESQWIFPKDLDGAVDTHWEVLCNFEAAAGGVLEITADARYAAWVNGKFAGAGPYPDWPQTRSIDSWTLDGLLRPGPNELRVLVYQIGQDTASYVQGSPGLAFSITAGGRVLAVSGTSCAWRRSPGYVPGVAPRITPQLGFGFAYEATADEEDGGGKPIEPGECRGLSETGRHFRPRPIPACELRERVETRLVAQGLFRRAENSGNQPAAWRMQRDWLSFREVEEIFPGKPEVPLRNFGNGLRFLPLAPGSDGVWLVLDLGRETTGFLELELEAEGDALFEIAWGQHLDDLRVRAQVGERFFAITYRCRKGRQLFREPLTRIGGRYLQVHISGEFEGLCLRYLGLRESLYPVADPGPCPSEDALDQSLYALCARTLHLCMGDHYDDTPWREQGLYANDALNQSLSGYAVFGEVKYPQASLDLLGSGLRGDGFLELCAPAKIPITIPAFSFAWILAVWRNVEFSGDTRFAKAQLPRVSKILSASLERLTGPLLSSPRGTGYWHFYDWTGGGLDGTVDGDATRFAVLESDRHDAPLNAFFQLALLAGASVAERCGHTADAARWHEAAGALRTQASRAFFSAQSGLFSSFLEHDDQSPPPPSELVQALALLAGWCSPEQARSLRFWILDPIPGGLIPSSLSQSLYSYEALLEDEALHPAIRERVRDTWAAMLAGGATACWEMESGGWAFDRAGSLCHGWSAIPAYIFARLADASNGTKKGSMAPAFPSVPSHF